MVEFHWMPCQPWKACWTWGRCFSRREKMLLEAAPQTEYIWYSLEDECMGTTKVSFSIHHELLHSLDALAGQIGSSRSSLIEEAIRLHLQRVKGLEFRRQISEAYADGLDKVERRQLAAMKRKARKIASREKW
jgi:predicted transcriptional regulator